MNPVYSGLFWMIFLGSNRTIAMSSLILLKFRQVTLAMAFLSLLLLLNIWTLTRFLILSVDFPCTLFERSLKKSFSKSVVAAFRLACMKCMILAMEIVWILESGAFSLIPAYYHYCWLSLCTLVFWQWKSILSEHAECTRWHKNCAISHFK